LGLSKVNGFSASSMEDGVEPRVEACASGG